MLSKKEIFLIDGSSFVFRAYHAAAGTVPLMTSNGQMTQVIFRVINMVRRILKEYQPLYLSVVMDAANSKNFRHEIYPDYKANRSIMPETIIEQLIYIKKIISAMGIHFISVPGVEADDVIGTIASQANETGFKVVIISNDKDFAQLINENIEMLDTMTNIRLNHEGVLKKFGVNPDQIIEYLALIGDPSDNIPGIPKVGPKTAAKWLSKYGSIDELVKNADCIAGKVGETLRRNLNQLWLSKALTTIKCNVTLNITPEDLLLQEPDHDALRAYYINLEFKSLLNEFTYLPSKNPINTKHLTYETIQDVKVLDRWIKKLKNSSIFAIVTETSSKNIHQAEIVGISFSIGPGEAAYLPLGHKFDAESYQIPTNVAMNQLKPILECKFYPKTGQNLKFDVKVLQKYNIQLNGITHDIILLSYVLEGGHFRHNIETLVSKYLSKDQVKWFNEAQLKIKQRKFFQINIEEATQYAAKYADLTLQVHNILVLKLDKYPKIKTLFYEIELPLMNVLVRIENHGIKIDSDQLRKQSADINARLVEIEKKAHALAKESFNLRSPTHIRKIFYQKQGITVQKKTPKGHLPTDEKVLHKLSEDNELAKLILEYRRLSKLKSTYTDKLPISVNSNTGRIHTSYRQAMTATGRLSSAEPNLQNIPIRTIEGSRIREAFIPETGNLLLTADYSQIELRLIAHLSKDYRLINAFQNGIDIHIATAAEIFGSEPDKIDIRERRIAKTINFGLIYGMSAFGLSRQLQIKQQEAKQYIEIYFKRYSGVKNYLDTVKKIAQKQGFVETLFGRRFNLPEINSSNAVRRHYAERNAINAPTQGSAADLIKLSMLSVDRWILENNSSAKIILQLHDELVLEIDKHEVEFMKKLVSELMCSISTLDVPLVVNTGSGKNWKQAH